MSLNRETVERIYPFLSREDKDSIAERPLVMVAYFLNQMYGVENIETAEEMKRRILH